MSIGPLRHRIIRHVFKKHLHKVEADPNVSPEDRQTVRTLLANHEAFNAATDELIDRMETAKFGMYVTAEEQEAMLGTTAAAGGFTNFLQWLLDHKDAIIALIKEIISLFGL